jgi:predicted TPR repeat methyltransferase
MIPSKRLDEDTLREMAGLLSAEDAAEMAIPSYLHKNPLLRTMAWWRVELLAERMQRAARAIGHKPLTILDYGCGSGVLFADALDVADEVIGVDLVLDAARLLVVRRGYQNVRLLGPGEAEQQIEEKSVDIILAGEVLEHVEPLGPALSLFRKWMRNAESRLLVTLPTENQLYRLGRRIAGFQGHYHHANAASITPEIERAGFSLVRRETIPLPGPLAIYWCMDFMPR